MFPKYDVHPAAAIFPEMEGAEFDAFVADIKEHGQREAIVLLSGLILDGRNRYRACKQLGITPKVTHWNSDGSPEAYVISKNVHRRHLTASQRAMLGATMANMPRGYRSDIVREPVSGSVKPISVSHAAKIVGTSKEAVHIARRILKNAEPEEIEAVQQGEKSVYEVDKGVPRSSPKKKPKQNHYRVRSDYWRQFKQGIDLLSGLPSAEDVINSIPGQETSWQLYGRRAQAAFDWLETFMEKFRDSDRNKA